MSTPSRSVLIVAYHFPPMGGSGVQRPLKFVASLPRLGWRPIVLCGGHSRYPLRDASLCEEIPAVAHIERHLGWEPAALAERMRRMLVRSCRSGGRLSRLEQRLYWRLDRLWPRAWVPEAEWLWSMSALGAARRLARRFNVDAVMTSGGPFSVHRIGAALKHRLGLPWVAEFRDPLVGNFGYQPAHPRIDACWRRLERTTARLADHVVVTCDECGEDLRRRHPMLPRERVSTITNGFDAGDCEQILQLKGVRRDGAASGAPATRNCWEIAHVGAWYGRQSIEPVLEAFRAWLRRRPELAGRARLRLVGSISSEQRRHIRPDDERFLRLDEYVVHRAAVAAMRAADALLLTVPAEPGGRLCIPAKTFEYLASGRPIVAAVHPASSLERLLRLAGGVTFVRDRRPGAFSSALDEAFERFGRRGGQIASRGSILRDFRRDVLASRLADVLNKCCGGARSTIAADARPRAISSFPTLGNTRPVSAAQPSGPCESPPSTPRRRGVQALEPQAGNASHNHPRGPAAESDRRELSCT